MRRILFTFAAALLVGFAAVAVLAGHDKIEVDVTTAPVSVGAISHNVVATGTLQARTTVDVGAQVSGVIQTLNADYNSIVRAGDVIARLDPVAYDADLRQAKAALDQAEADVRQREAADESARLALVRAEQLASKSLIPTADLDA